MEKETIGYCPVCNEKLMATKLSCNNCELDLTGEFALNRFSYLNKEEQEFVLLFLSREGSFKDLQSELSITYQKAKATLNDILIKMELKNDEGEDEMLETKSGAKSVAIKKDEHFVVKAIKEKLNDCGGTATIPLITAGKYAVIWFDEDKSGLQCDKIPLVKQLTWEVFVEAYNIAAAQDGEVYKGYARAGKLGSEKLPLKSLEGYIAHAVHGVPKGGSAFSPGFVIAAVLDWVGIFINKRGSTISLESDATCVSTYQEALKNAETFVAGLDNSTIVRERLNYFKHWYYFEEVDIFAPSKFIGYRDMDFKAYEVGFNNGLDGKATEKALKKVFIEVEENTSGELYKKLVNFFQLYGKQPNAGACVHFRKI